MNAAKCVVGLTNATLAAVEPLFVAGTARYWVMLATAAVAAVMVYLVPNAAQRPAARTVLDPARYPPMPPRPGQRPSKRG